MFGRATHPKIPRYRASRRDGPDLRENVVQAIGRTLRECKNDYNELTLVERNVQRVDIFDSYFTNDGLDGFFANVPLPEVWRETEDALRAFGAPAVADILHRAQLAYTAAESIEDPDAQNRAFLALNSFRREIRALDVDFEELIRRYVDRNYPWLD